MFGLPLDTLLICVATTPLIGWLMEYAKLARYRDRACGFYALIGMLVSSYFLYDLYQEVAAKSIVVITYLKAYGPPLGACLEIDMLSIFMASLIAGLGIAACLYSTTVSYTHLTLPTNREV